MIGLPDVPRWVEAHGIAADPAHWRTPLGDDGFALGHDEARLVVVAGDPDRKALAALAASYPRHTFLVERRELAEQLADRPCERAILHTLPDPEALPDPDGATLLGDEPVPPSLADELAWAKTRGAVFAVHVDGQPAAFAYAPWRSATWFDVSVDTVAGARQLGLGTIVAAAMIRHERAQGREPVWGADEDNVASLRLAKRLGFEAVDEIWVAACAR